MVSRGKRIFRVIGFERERDASRGIRCNEYYRKRAIKCIIIIFEKLDKCKNLFSYIIRWSDIVWKRKRNITSLRNPTGHVETNGVEARRVKLIVTRELT